jgi:hypothetical protein
MPIDVISGPFCQQFFANYIAHETDTAEVGVPIIMEDGSGNILPENAIFGLYGTECVEGQPVCCNTPSEVRFVGQLKTEIFYTATMRAKHGTWPQVYVYYYYPTNDGELILGGILTRVSMVGMPATKIIIDHGGVATGIVKIV